jgi:hypothetical protein
MVLLDRNGVNQPHASLRLAAVQNFEANDDDAQHDHDALLLL